MEMWLIFLGEILTDIKRRVVRLLISVVQCWGGGCLQTNISTFPSVECFC